MSDQCHSTTETKPSHKARTPHKKVGVSATGASYFRGLEDLSDTPEFRNWMEREFPKGASELLSDSRRTFLRLMGASLALAGATTLPGCRRPDHKILAYSKDVPEETVPGKALFFATSMPLPGGGAEGLLIETHEGRPTKVEGNPLHPQNRGKSSVWSQASILGLYDPDRLKDPQFTDGDSSDPTMPRSWDDFKAWWNQIGAAKCPDGDGLALIVDRRTSPALSWMKDHLMRAKPKARWVWWDPMSWDESRRGLAGAFGRPVREILTLENALCILSIGRDFLGGAEPGGLANARGFAAGRRALTAGDTMSRLYVAEANFTITGGRADHRLKAAPSVLPAVLVAVAKSLASNGGLKNSDALSTALASVGIPAGASIDQGWVDAVAADLAANAAKSLVVAGPGMPKEIHALAAALNVALGSVGSTVSYVNADADEGEPCDEALRSLTDAMDAGQVTTLVSLNCNPVFDAPADFGFAEKMKTVPTRIALSIDDNETVQASNWRLNAAHYLEAWGDTRSHDGAISPIQPMIAPLYGGKSDLEVLAIVSGHSLKHGYDVVRQAWADLVNHGALDASFEKTWRRALHDGVLANAGAAAPADVKSVLERAASALTGLKLSGGPGDASLDVEFAVWHIGDGRFANNGWLQELPDPATHMVWDNAALVSPRTAERLGLTPTDETEKKRKGRMANLTLRGKQARLPVWVLPGMPDNTVVLPVGYGRTVVGNIGEHAGFNVFSARSSAGMHTDGGATLERATGADAWHEISTTQSHGTMEGRAIVRQVDLPAWQAHADHVEVNTDAYGRERRLNFAERLGELSHTPVNESIYVNPLNQSTSNAAAGSEYSKGPQWGMTIDLAACTGCNACTIACQSENNIPIVGKIEVNKGREMQWIRVDRYFVGGDPSSLAPPWDDPHLHMAFQPVACVQCENAPCETVCPVNATVHGPEGINYMAYNRCIGTRYCANNCPYKVRRFNFFQYGDSKYQGGFVGQEALPGGGPKNQNLVPPRLRAKLDEITRMQMNPNVTVRPRGVMEKCNYCLQRINEARIQVKLKNLPGVPDGFFQAACQQACPSDAIVFGDILDTTSNDGRGSRARQMRGHARSYMLLGFLNTRPRTLHMADVRNPNPAIRVPNSNPFHHHGESDGDGGHEGPDGDHGHEHTRGTRDEGYIMSLSVLGGRA